MKNIQQTLKRIDERLNHIQPNTMDEFINIVHSTEGAGDYGTSFSIVHYKGYLQGVRVYISGKKYSHVLPKNGRVYSVFKGLEKYYEAGYKIEHVQDNTVNVSKFLI